MVRKPITTAPTGPDQTEEKTTINKKAKNPQRNVPSKKERIKGLEIFEDNSGADDDIDMIGTFESTGHDPKVTPARKGPSQSYQPRNAGHPAGRTSRTKPPTQQRRRPNPSQVKTEIVQPNKRGPQNQQVKPQKKVKKKGNIKQGEDGSMLHLMEDMSVAAGAHYAKQDQKQFKIEGKLDLVKRDPLEKDNSSLTQKQKEIEKAYKKIQAKRSAEATGDLVPDEELTKRRYKIIFLSVIPQVILLAAIIVFGIIYLNKMFFQGKWTGQVFDKSGRNVTFELQLDRVSNEITGTAYFIRPAGETPATVAEKSKIPMTVLEIMDVMKGTVSGSFDRNNASFVVRPESQNKSMSIKFNGQFDSKDNLKGEVSNDLKSKGSFTLSRIGN